MSRLPERNWVTSPLCKHALNVAFKPIATSFLAFVTLLCMELISWWGILTHTWKAPYQNSCFWISCWGKLLHEKHKSTKLLTKKCIIVTKYIQQACVCWFGKLCFCIIDWTNIILSAILWMAEISTTILQHLRLYIRGCCMACVSSIRPTLEQLPGTATGLWKNMGNVIRQLSTLQ